MKWLKAMIGYMMAGLIVMSVWGEMGNFGILGGYAAAIIIIGPMWFINHYLNLTGNDEGVSFVDMGLAIGVCGIMRDTFINGGDQFTAGLPTMALVCVGAVLGGVIANLIERQEEAKK